MLRVALLLLGCVLSKYLWEIDTTVNSVVIGVTSFGVLFYLFVLVAGATLDGCPYQVPWTHVIRYLPGLFVKNSALYGILFEIQGHPDKYKVTIRILMYPLVLLAAVVLDAFRFGRMTFRSLQVVSALKACSWLFGTSTIQKQTSDYQATKLDFRGVSWMLQTLLDKTINFLTLNFLETTPTLPGFNANIALCTVSIYSVTALSPMTVVGCRSLAVRSGLREHLPRVYSAPFPACWLRNW